MLVSILLDLLCFFTVYAGLFAFSSICAREPIFAIGAGSGVGMIANFILSREIVFSTRKS